MKYTSLIFGILLIILGILIMAGCSTTRHVVTGGERPPIDVSLVQLMTEIPPGATRVGVVMVRSSGAGQRAMDRAVREAKERAAKLGANGIAITQTGMQRTMYYWYPSDDTHLQFQAFVIP